MILADDGLPSVTLIGAVLLGGALAAGGANTINCWIERDRDRVMHRTQRRPLPAGQIEPSHALVFGIALVMVFTGEVPRLGVNLFTAEALLLAAAVLLLARNLRRLA